MRPAARNAEMALPPLAQPGRVAVNELEQARIYRWLNGLATIPTLLALHDAGCLTALKAHSRLSVSSLAVSGQCELARGPLLACLRTLAFNGWIALAGNGSGAIVSAGPDLANVADWCSNTSSFLRDLVRLQADFEWLCVGFRRHGESDAATSALIRWASLVGRRPHPAMSAVGRQLAGYVDGVLIAPFIAALAMSRSHDGLDDQTSGQALVPDLEAIFGVAGHEGAKACEAFLIECGLIARVRGQFLLTREGRAKLSEGANFGVPVSYGRLLADAHGFLTGAQDYDAGAVDRAMNVWASGNSAILGRFSEGLRRDVLMPLFDALPIDQQPAGIADMGCGSGARLEEWAAFIRDHTRRGRCLDRHPLVLIGADPSSVARQAAMDTLAELAKSPNYMVLVVEGQVEAPEQFAEEVSSAHLAHPIRPGEVAANDLIHVQSFVLHNRRLRVASKRRARRRLARLSARAHADALLDALNASAAEADEHVTAGRVRAAFVIDHVRNGRLLRGWVSACDTATLIARWKPYLSYGLALVEPHVPSHDGGDAWLDGRHELDPAACVWGMHAASEQFLTRWSEHEVAMTLGGLSCLVASATATESLSLGWWVATERIYEAAS